MLSVDTRPMGDGAMHPSAAEDRGFVVSADLMKLLLKDPSASADKAFLRNDLIQRIISRGASDGFGLRNGLYDVRADFKALFPDFSHHLLPSLPKADVPNGKDKICAVMLVHHCLSHITQPLRPAGEWSMPDFHGSAKWSDEEARNRFASAMQLIHGLMLKPNKRVMLYAAGIMSGFFNCMSGGGKTVTLLGQTAVYEQVTAVKAAPCSPTPSYLTPRNPKRRSDGEQEGRHGKRMRFTAVPPPAATDDCSMSDLSQSDFSNDDIEELFIDDNLTTFEESCWHCSCCRCDDRIIW